MTGRFHCAPASPWRTRTGVWRLRRLAVWTRPSPVTTEPSRSSPDTSRLTTIGAWRSSASSGLATRSTVTISRRVNPGHLDARLNRGIVQRQLGHLDLALSNFEQVIALYPKSAKAHLNRGATLQELRRLDQALMSYEHALKLNPDNVRIYGNRWFCPLDARKVQGGIFIT